MTPASTGASIDPQLRKTLVTPPAAARSLGATTDATKLWRVGTSICEIANRISRTVIAAPAPKSAQQGGAGGNRGGGFGGWRDGGKTRDQQDPDCRVRGQDAAIPGEVAPPRVAAQSDRPPRQQRAQCRGD